MKKIYLFYALIPVIILLLSSCKREDNIFPPGVITASVDEITGTSARVGGKVIDNGGDEISERGVCWGTSASPETTGTKLQSGTGDGVYYEVLSGLVPGTKYYVKAFAVNSAGISYGEETFFTTQISLPIVTTSPVSDLTPTTASIGGNVLSDGGFVITERGVYWGPDTNPRITGTKIIIGNGLGEFSTTITGLSRNLTYYAVAYARNIKGAVYGGEISFTTEPGPAIVTTSSATGVTPHSAKISGNVSSDGGAAVTERGFYWGRTPDPVVTGMKLTLGDGTGSFSQLLDTLKPAVTYYFRAFASNSTGTSYGEEKNFKTSGKMPKIDKVSVSDITRQSAKIVIQVDSGALETSVVVMYGTTSSYGSLSGVINLPPTKADTVISIPISSLVFLTYYHYSVRAENELGTIYTSDREFRTVMTGVTGTVSDYENNTYGTIGIGYQEWMTTNLRSVKFNNGTSIPRAVRDSLWNAQTGAAYCWYGNDSASNVNTYGALYNWEAVHTGLLCPAGWEVPSAADVAELVTYVGGAGVAGKMLKDPGSAYWRSPSVDSTDVYKFSARGGGKRSDAGIYDFKTVEGNWWTSDEYSTLNASFYNILFNYSNLFQAYYNKKTGMSVRCVRSY